jgi:hypothetical protein
MPREGLDARRDAAVELLRRGAVGDAAEVLFENVLRLLEDSEYAWWLRLAVARERRSERRRGGEHVTAPALAARAPRPRSGRSYLLLRR